MHIGHDNSGIGAKWYLEKVILRVPSNAPKPLEFQCRRWLQGDATSAELFPLSSDDVEIKLRVKTANEKGSGTDGNVFVEVFCANGSLPVTKLVDSENRDKFEQGQTDTFSMYLPGKLGDVQCIAMVFEPTMLSKSWKLEYVSVEKPGSAVQMFPCNDWFSKKTSLRRVLQPGSRGGTFSDDEDGEEEGANPNKLVARFTKVTYKVEVKTADVKGAGTDANVFLKIVGEKVGGVDAGEAD